MKNVQLKQKKTIKSEAINIYQVSKEKKKLTVANWLVQIYCWCYINNLSGCVGMYSLKSWTKFQMLSKTWISKSTWHWPPIYTKKITVNIFFGHPVHVISEVKLSIGYFEWYWIGQWSKRGSSAIPTFWVSQKCYTFVILNWFGSKVIKKLKGILKQSWRDLFIVAELPIAWLLWLLAMKQERLTASAKPTPNLPEVNSHLHLVPVVRCSIPEGWHWWSLCVYSLYVFY